MGIKGLLKHLSPIRVRRHISEFSKLRAVYDGSIGLHDGLYSCGSDLIYNKPCASYLKKCMRVVDMAQHFNIKITIVIDGANLPSKQRTHIKRQGERDQHLAKAKEAEANGDKKLAEKHYASATPVSSRMIFNWVELLRSKNVEYVIAPFESDAQIAWMCREGLADFVITDDSDLIVYECPNVFCKMDDQGYGDFFEYANIRTMPIHKTMIPSSFRAACIMSGCDYLENINKVGLATAFKAIASQPTVTDAIKSVYKNATQPFDSYMQDFFKAERTFLHQVVFDTRNQKLVRLRPLPNDFKDEDDLIYAGSLLYYGAHPWTAFLVCRGWIDPKTMKTYVHQPSSYMDEKMLQYLHHHEKIWGCIETDEKAQGRDILRDLKSYLSIDPSTIENFDDERMALEAELAIAQRVEDERAAEIVAFNLIEHTHLYPPQFKNPASYQPKRVKYVEDDAAADDDKTTFTLASTNASQMCVSSTIIVTDATFSTKDDSSIIMAAATTTTAAGVIPSVQDNSSVVVTTTAATLSPTR